MTTPTQGQSMKMAVQAGFTSQAAVMAPKEFHALVTAAYKLGKEDESKRIETAALEWVASGGGTNLLAAIRNQGEQT